MRYWKRCRDRLETTGPSSLVVIWVRDARAENEILVSSFTYRLPRKSDSPQDLDTNSDCPVAAIASDQGSLMTFGANFTNDTVNVSTD